VGGAYGDLRPQCAGNRPGDGRLDSFWRGACPPFSEGRDHVLLYERKSLTESFLLPARLSTLVPESDSVITQTGAFKLTSVIFPENFRYNCRPCGFFRYSCRNALRRRLERLAARPASMDALAAQVRQEKAFDADSSHLLQQTPREHERYRND